jgi:hypothetical protein
MLLREGQHVLVRSAEAFDLEYAAASSGWPSYIRVWVADEMVEDCRIGGSLHTWWSSNPLISKYGRWPEQGEEFSIEVGPTAILRLEGYGFEKSLPA